MHVEKVLGDLGLKVMTVPEQREPDGDFPTVEKPNPEEVAKNSCSPQLAKSLSHMIVVRLDVEHMTGKEAIELVRLRQTR